MSEKALRQLVGALAVLVGAWVVASFLRGGSQSITASGGIADFFEALDGPSVASIRIERPDGEVRLESGEDGWSVNGLRADAGGVARLLAAVTTARAGDLIAANPENHDRMGVSADSALVVTFNGGDELLIGHAGPRFGTSYVRLPEEDEVYLLEGDLGTQLDREESSWRDRTMFEIDTASVGRIEVDRDDGAFALVRGDSSWTIEGGGEVSETSLQGVLTELSTLTASGFLTEGDSVALLPRERAVRAFGADGVEIAGVVIGAGEVDRWARTTRDDYLYRISTFRADRVAPSRSEAAGDTDPG